MKISPQLGAVRAQPHGLHDQQASMARAHARWRTRPEVSAVLRELARYDRGTELPFLPSLSALLTDLAVADGVAGALLHHLLPALRGAPFGLVPLRHQSTAHHDVVELARCGSAALSLMAYRPRAGQDAASATFASGERHEICLHGRAAGREIALAGEPDSDLRLACAPVELSRGWSASYDNARRTKVVERVLEPLVVLRLARDPASADPAREYRLDDGALLHQSAADRRDSRREIALAVLGSMERRDALPAMKHAAQRGPAHVRWEALRQTLSLDSAGGFRLLCAIAQDNDDPLQAPAAALRMQLLNAHPSLAALDEAILCPA